MAGEAIGAGCVLAVVVFLVTRKLCGPGGARHRARLNRIAGGEEQENRLPLYVSDWLPYAAAVLAAIVGGLFSLVKAGVPLHRDFSAHDLPQLASGFISGCEKSCAAQRDATFCGRFCDCTLAALRTRHPGDEAFASWMQAGPNTMDAVRAEVMSAQAACMPALEPPPVPSQQPPTHAPQREQAEAAEQPSLDVPQYEPSVMQRIHEDFEPFLKWASAAKIAPEKLTGAEVCATPNEPSAGTCTKSTAAPGLGDQVFSASYKPGQPGAIRLAVTVPLLVGCDALAPSRTLAQWRQGESEKQLCEFSGGTLGGLQLLAVRSRYGTSLFAFTPAYRAYDAAFRVLASPSG